MSRSERVTGAHGVGMDREAIAIGDPEQADDIRRIALEHGLGGDADAVDARPTKSLDGSFARAPLAGGRARGRAWPWAWPALLERRADDRGEIADILGDEKVMLHEALGAREAGAIMIAEFRGEHRLQIEGEALLGAAGHEMQLAAHAPQKFLAALEQRQLRAA